MAGNRPGGLARRDFLKGGAAGAVAGGAIRPDVSCPMRPALPAKIVSGGGNCFARQTAGALQLGNDFLEVGISPATGVLTLVSDKLNARQYALAGDQTGFLLWPETERKLEWRASADSAHAFQTTLADRPEASHAALVDTADDFTVTITYSIRKDQFWVQRRIAVESQRTPLRFERLVYGKLETPGGRVNVLELGKFDRPRLVSLDRGGLFAGVGWWFYTVDSDSVYQNTGMAYSTHERFESEPWYLGVFAAEDGEPYPGWLWYKTFLELRKTAHDRQSSWCYWNAGWGQWGIDFDDPSAPAYIELAHQLGARGIAFGSGIAGRGLPAYTRAARDSETAKRNLALLRKRNIAAGFLEHGGLKEKWADPRILREKLEQLDEYAKEGFQALHFDFFATADTFTAHRNAADYFRAARERLAYTECHLGMAQYGPQFQREVLINHPTDTHGNDISRFSSDWVTFLGFRHSRRGWQQRYQYLMPEYALYYFLTHYSNWGHARRYSDPEPQQFLYGPHAYCGVAYNFHDSFGFREALAAASAFSPFYVLGHIELRMPERDLAFARDFLRWTRENTDALRPARVCFETDDACVVSKLCGARGAIYLLNYSPGRRIFHITLPNAVKLRIRQVYPKRLPSFDGSAFDLEVRGESAAILDVNGGLRTLPPENSGAFPIDLDAWEISELGCNASFRMPDIRRALEASRDPNLPADLRSLDQEPPDAAMPPIGRGRLPERFLEVYGFRDGRIAETWKFAPWAFRDRVWLVYRPAPSVLLSDPLPAATINGKPVPLIPRVDYRPKRVEEWSCPIFFADVTDSCRYGGMNSVRLSRLHEPKPASCYITSVADRS